MWGTDDLLTSFDGANAFRPWRLNKQWKTSGGWYHVDQNHLLPDGSQRGKVCIQGLVTLLDASSDTGGLVVVPRSHKDHEGLCNRTGQVHSALVAVMAEDPVFREVAQLICANEGNVMA